ncbi:MAG: DUF362 domain-containing protein [Clostridia bacterium]|nr:DUF362 domain-containing protein [Clostridia bacterium]
MRPKVYFTKELTSEAVLRLLGKIEHKLSGRVAVKLHSGEPGNQNFIKPEFWRLAVERVGGTVVECNTAYDGGRNTTEKHLETIKAHGWDEYFKFDLMDAEGPDLVLPYPGGKVIKKDYVGKNLANYDSMLVLSHFKGHPMGGYGGALKQLSIGVASSYGKAYIHGAGDVEVLWNAEHDAFLESMADAAGAVIDYMGGKIAYINVMKNMSVDCDCCAVAEDPCIPDMGVLASTDPVAIDKACLDIVSSCDAPGKEHFMERVLSRNGYHTIDSAEKLGYGTQDYELVLV